MKVILVNSEEEWKKFKKVLKQKKTLPKTPYGEMFKGKINKRTVTFLNTGAGKTLSAGATQYAVDKLKADEIFLIGCAGGVSEELKICDLAAAKKAVQNDYNEGMGNNLDFFDQKRIAKIDISRFDKKLKSLNIITGIFASADSDMGFKERKDLKKHKNILCADWETYSVAKVCKINKIPLLIIKGVSDIPEKSSEKNGKQQQKQYRKNIYPILKKIVTEILPEFIN